MMQHRLKAVPKMAEHAGNGRIRARVFATVFATLLIPLMPLSAQTTANATDNSEGQRLLTALKQEIEGEYRVGSATLTTKVSGEPCFTKIDRTNKVQPTVSYGGGRLRWEGFDNVEVSPRLKNQITLLSSYATNTGRSLNRTDLMLDTPVRAEAVAGAMNALISYCKGQRARLDSEKLR